MVWLFICVCMHVTILLYILEFERPELRDVNKCVVPEYAHRWEELGILLHFKQSELAIILSDFRNDAKQCCRNLLSTWLEKNSNASWDQLIRAIDDLPPSCSETAYQGVN